MIGFVYSSPSSQKLTKTVNLPCFFLLFQVISSSMVDDLSFLAVSGPTWDQQVPFQWSKSDFDLEFSHEGMPDRFAFDPVNVNWNDWFYLARSLKSRYVHKYSVIKLYDWMKITKWKESKLYTQEGEGFQQTLCNRDVLVNIARVWYILGAEGLWNFCRPFREIGLIIRVLFLK